MIGIWFDSEDDALDYVLENGLVDDVITEDGTDDWQECLRGGLYFQECTGYEDKGGCLGVMVGRDDLLENSGGIDSVYTVIREIIPPEDYHKVKPHVWARYW